MTYIFEKLAARQDDPERVDVVFYQAPVVAYGTEWPPQRFILPASSLYEPGKTFDKLAISPDARDDAMVALIEHFNLDRETRELRAQCPSVLAGRTQQDIPQQKAQVAYSTGEMALR